MGFRPVLEDPDPWNVFGAGIDAKARFSQEDGAQQFDNTRGYDAGRRCFPPSFRQKLAAVSEESVRPAPRRPPGVHATRITVDDPPLGSGFSERAMRFRPSAFAR
jgi:hypothetical protein